MPILFGHHHLSRYNSAHVLTQDLDDSHVHIDRLPRVAVVRRFEDSTDLRDADDHADDEDDDSAHPPTEAHVSPNSSWSIHVPVHVQPASPETEPAVPRSIQSASTIRPLSRNSSSSDHDTAASDGEPDVLVSDAGVVAEHYNPLHALPLHGDLDRASPLNFDAFHTLKELELATFVP